MAPEVNLLKNRSPLLRFVLTVFAWLPVMFVIWYFAAPILIFPAKLLAQVFTQVAFGDLVAQVSVESAKLGRPHVLIFETTLRPGEATATGGLLSFSVNGLLYSFGLPFLAALILAALEKGFWKKLLIGYLVIVPFIFWGVTAGFLVQITADPFLAAQVGFSALQREIVAFAYQFGTLILPTVVPAIVWVLTHRRFLESMREQMNALSKKTGR